MVLESFSPVAKTRVKKMPISAAAFVTTSKFPVSFQLLLTNEIITRVQPTWRQLQTSTDKNAGWSFLGDDVIPTKKQAHVAL